MATALLNKRSKPAAATPASLYTVPSGTSTVLSNIICCNQSTETTVKIAVRPLGVSVTADHYIVSGTTINDNDVLEIGRGITLNATDIVEVLSDSGNVSFNLFGEETT